LYDEPAAPTLDDAMAPLRLFALDDVDAQGQDDSNGTLTSSLSVPPEHLEAAEGYLETRGDTAEPLATIQAAILLCEGAGEISKASLGRVEIDHVAFPRAAAAIERTREVLNKPRSAWPEGFWPRFLLGVLVGEGSPHG
jgi:hypothetical protein